MQSNQSVSDYLIKLYNGYTSIAERVNKEDLESVHISTSLDEQIPIWIKEKNDVVLTGNPGDGKTHLMNILDYQGLLTHAYLEKDASQRSSKDILDTWSKKRDEGVPFVLAINHAPLRRLSLEVEKSERYQKIAHLRYVLDEIENTTFYHQPQESKLNATIIVDLHQRELLTSEIIKKLARKLCAVAVSSSCTDCPPHKCPVEYNARALSQERILDNIVAVLHMVARRGFHATMRDLTGLLAYIITGGTSCATRWQPVDDTAQPPRFDDYAYYNLLFTGRSPLFAAINATFDPAQYSDTHTDMLLWTGGIQDGWLMPDMPITQPATLTELRRLKRRYFFEHDHNPAELLSQMLPSTERKFNTLIIGASDDRVECEALIGMINALYAPVRNQSDQSYRLRLWNSHRYSVGSMPGYVAMRSIPADKLVIYRPQPAPHLAPAMEIRQDHVLLGVRQWRPGDPALRVDWPMYQALAAARNGTPIDVQPFHILRRLDLFLRSLGFDAGGVREVEMVEWSDHRRRRSSSVRINRTTRSYEKEPGA